MDNSDKMHFPKKHANASIKCICIEEENKRKQHESDSNYFYSLCKNVNSFENIEIDKVNNIVKSLRKIYIDLDFKNKYISLLHNLKNKLCYERINSDEALFILIYT